MTNKIINSPVSITAVGFGPGMSQYPKRMEWKGRTYCFVDRGIRTRVRRGDSIWSTLTMSDGRNNFCLREMGGLWTLVSVC